ncbi:probable E3 ubiquitin-protein ligase MID2 [Mercenaria mercenaria]|uniref:probable E3 ubiquitin-protein ligase MID2 n=1 Tax=Mercenaria mercenaria TaxID=6596 RepID=UPI00234EDB11|nr:probable E3 ubiquitin-protein ligase MID2 [Mercenaria mercenaria]
MGNVHNLSVKSHSHHSTTMEEELTCPVCLELYADPLLLPCSHSICKKCLQDIVDNRYKSGKDGLDCPSCRKSHPVSRTKVGKLPRNLALENIVFRYQEIQSQNMTRSRKSLDLTLDFPSPSSPSQCASPLSPEVENIVFSEDVLEMCGLCEENSGKKASWYCEQCCVAYCQSCLDNFHPKRGPLAHHKLRKPVKDSSSGKQAFCCDHEAEVAAIFCDKCQLLVCHLCVCEGVGKHSQHKILSLDTALVQTKETVSHTKERLENMVATLSDQSAKMAEISEDIESIHAQASQKIDLQYQRLIDDITSSLRQHRHATLHRLSESKSKILAKLRTQIEENRQQLKTMENLMESCKKLLDEDHTKGLLMRASDVAPLVQKQEAVSDSTADEAEQCQSIIPVIKSPASPGKDAPRVGNKCLTTWGFNSSSFTAEPLSFNAMWSVTVEKNASQMGDLKNGYIFGVGISFDKLSLKDQVGLNSLSHGIVCTGGNLVYSHNGKIEQLMPLDGLPLSVTIYCTIDQSEGILLAYTITDASWGDTLHGKKILVDQFSRKEVFPVFTVSQRVKMQFPTYV